jgi:uroporphyrin-3 C-methyltransferase
MPPSAWRSSNRHHRQCRAAGGLTLRQADERLARFNQPRLERCAAPWRRIWSGRAAAGVTDITSLTIRLDEVIRQVDELPLLSAPERRGRCGRWHGGRRRRLRGGHGVCGRLPPPGLGRRAGASAGPTFAGYVWQEVRSLVRVTRIDKPEAMLVAPEQAFFLRENLKLRLLNARWRCCRGSSTPRSPTCATRSRRWTATSIAAPGAWCWPAKLVRQVTSQARLVSVPRPDATLAAIATAAAGR